MPRRRHLWAGAQITIMPATITAAAMRPGAAREPALGATNGGIFRRPCGGTWACQGRRAHRIMAHAVSRPHAAWRRGNGLITATWPPLRVMAKDVRMSAMPYGGHPLGPRGATGRVPLGGAAEHAVQSMVPGRALARHGGRRGPGPVAAGLGGPSLEAPPAAPGAVGRCLGDAGQAGVGASYTADGVSIDPPDMGSGALAARLEPASAPEGGAGKSEIAFSGMTVRIKGAMIKLAIFGEARPETPAVPGVLGRAMGAPSGHCGALAK